MYGYAGFLMYQLGEAECQSPESPFPFVRIQGGLPVMISVTAGGWKGSPGHSVADTRLLRGVWLNTDVAA